MKLSPLKSHQIFRHAYFDDRMNFNADINEQIKEPVRCITQGHVYKNQILHL